MNKYVVLLAIFISFFGNIAEGLAIDPDPNVEVRTTVSGYVKDASNGESLIGAHVFITELKTGTSTNLYGFYSLSLKAGTYEIVYSYMGFVTFRKKIELSSNITLNIELEPETKSLQEVEVVAQRPDLNVTNKEMSVNKLDMKTIRQIPALMGEVDLIKAIQMLPGVLPAAEGSSAFCVRGGSADQNLILLDEATVYNASHLMGFFSVFNNDAIRDIKLYKGDIPGQYGGRLASLLLVNMKEGNKKKFSGTGGIGVISSRLTLEGPIVKDNSSFIASGRRTYADLFLPLASEKDLQKSKLHFYDLNLKINSKLNERNHLFISGYFGRDVFSVPFASMIFGNNTLTMRWNHLYSQKMFSNLSLIYSKYVYELGMDDGANEFKWRYNMQDFGYKADFTYYIVPAFTLKFGVQSVYHDLDPGTFSSSGDNKIEMSLPSNYSLEHAAYLSAEHDITPRLSLKYGIRYSLFQNLGRATVYQYQNYEVVDTANYPSRNIYCYYGNWEPRFGMKYLINEETSLKGSYSRTVQYMQMASTSTAGTPLDLWYTSSPNVKPQLSDMVAVGVFRNFFDNTLETSFELYYKTMKNVIDFKDHAMVYGNTNLEADLRFGNASSYGAEAMVMFPTTRLNGWVSYTYSHTRRKIEAINDGNEYLAPYDKPHAVNVVLSYNISNRATIGATWVYSTGAPITLPTGRAEVGNVVFPIYTERNTYRMPDYHRLDLSLTLKNKEKPNRWWQGEWNFSLYNAYGRKNVWYIKFLQDKEDPNRTFAQKIYLFSFVPSVTYNFKF